MSRANSQKSDINFEIESGKGEKKQLANNKVTPVNNESSNTNNALAIQENAQQQ
jgi:hypothetical protein